MQAEASARRSNQVLAAMLLKCFRAGYDYRFQFVKGLTASTAHLKALSA